MIVVLSGRLSGPIRSWWVVVVVVVVMGLGRLNIPAGPGELCFATILKKRWSDAWSTRQLILSGAYMTHSISESYEGIKQCDKVGDCTCYYMSRSSRYLLEGIKINLAGFCFIYKKPKVRGRGPLQYSFRGPRIVNNRTVVRLGIGCLKLVLKLWYKY